MVLVLDLDTFDTDVLHRSMPGDDPYMGFHSKPEGGYVEVYSWKGLFYYEDEGFVHGPFDTAKGAYRDTLQRE